MGKPVPSIAAQNLVIVAVTGCYSLLQVVAVISGGIIMKTCNTCNAQKSEDEFSKWRGLCKTCLAKKQAAYREGVNTVKAPVPPVNT